MGEACCVESASKKREVDASLFFDDCYAHADVRSFSIFRKGEIGIIYFSILSGGFGDSFSETP